jgi:hypothetical protein
MFVLCANYLKKGLFSKALKYLSELHAKQGLHLTDMNQNLILPATLNIVACLLKARNVEPEKQPLLPNSSETTFVSRQRPRNRQRNNVRC